MKEILKQNISFLVVTLEDTVMVVNKKLPFRWANKHYLPCVYEFLTSNKKVYIKSFKLCFSLFFFVLPLTIYCT